MFGQSGQSADCRLQIAGIIGKQIGLGAYWIYSIGVECLKSRGSFIQSGYPLDPARGMRVCDRALPYLPFGGPGKLQAPRKEAQERIKGKGKGKKEERLSLETCILPIFPPFSLACRIFIGRTICLSIYQSNQSINQSIRPPIHRHNHRSGCDIWGTGVRQYVCYIPKEPSSLSLSESGLWGLC